MTGVFRSAYQVSDIVFRLEWIRYTEWKCKQAAGSVGFNHVGLRQTSVKQLDIKLAQTYELYEDGQELMSKYVGEIIINQYKHYAASRY
jgi:hypothetical protein